MSEGTRECEGKLVWCGIKGRSERKNERVKGTLLSPLRICHHHMLLHIGMRPVFLTGCSSCPITTCHVLPLLLSCIPAEPCSTPPCERRPWWRRRRRGDTRPRTPVASWCLISLQASDVLCYVCCAMCAVLCYTVQCDAVWCSVV